jgi:hypothetical protein
VRACVRACVRAHISWSSWLPKRTSALFCPPSMPTLPIKPRADAPFRPDIGTTAKSCGQSSSASTVWGQSVEHWIARLHRQSHRTHNQPFVKELKGQNHRCSVSRFCFDHKLSSCRSEAPRPARTWQ